MTRPSAPILTADYYTYSTYAQQDDFYGGFDPKHENQASRALNAGPTRMEPVVNKSHLRKNRNEKVSWAQFVVFLYLAFYIIALSCCGYLYFHNVRNKLISYVSVGLVFLILTGLMMQIGIAKRHPFLCIPFVVCRTMEVFTLICIIGAFFYAMFNKRQYIRPLVEELSKYMENFLPKHYNIDIVDAMFQVCLISLVIVLFLLAASIYVCRVSFECTMWVADQMRAKRIQQSYDSSRARIASDEFYCT